MRWVRLLHPASRTELQVSVQPLGKGVQVASQLWVKASPTQKRVLVACELLRNFKEVLSGQYPAMCKLLHRRFSLAGETSSVQTSYTVRTELRLQACPVLFIAVELIGCGLLATFRTRKSSSLSCEDRGGASSLADERQRH